jgi:hypothetical protein
MRRIVDALKGTDLTHFRMILGMAGNPDPNETRRRSAVSKLAQQSTFISDKALAPFLALTQEERERLLSDVVWQVTCYVEGSTTRAPAGKKVPLDHGFQLVESTLDGQTVFCVKKK